MHSECEDFDLDFVGNDEAFSLQLATEHFIGLGHQRLVMFGGHIDNSAARLRRSGHLDAMTDHGLAVGAEALIKQRGGGGSKP